MKLKPQPIQITEFLTGMFPGEICHIIAIHPENNDFKCQSFTVSDKALEQWCTKQNSSGYNCYFAVNRIDSSVKNRKAKRDDIKAGLFLHVDIDDLTSDTLERIQSFTLAPSVVLMSGGGYQLFWR